MNDTLALLFMLFLVIGLSATSRSKSEDTQNIEIHDLSSDPGEPEENHG